MKKRSLFAAVAMLIVSAIVMTSATYAWFAASTTAAFSEFSASVENTNGSIRISAQNSTGWTSTLSIDDITAAQANSVATSLNPVSFRWDSTNSVPAWLGAQIGSVTDENTGAVSQKFYAKTIAKGTDYTEFLVYVKSDNAGFVTVTPTFTRDVDFAYASISSGSTYKVLSGGTDSYYPLTTGLPTTLADGVTDAKTENSIIGTEDTGYATYIGSNPTAVSGVSNENGVLTLEFTAGQIQSVRVCMWAEGQDSNCVGTVSNKTESLSLAFAYSATNPNG